MNQRYLDGLIGYPCRDAWEVLTEAGIDSNADYALQKSQNRQGSLFEQDLERPVEYASKYDGVKGSGKIVIPSAWGLRKKDLESLNKLTLESIFYGTRNLWVPTEMLDLENPAEIVANYLAAGELKKYNSHLKNEQIPKRSFSELVKIMNRVAYGNPVFARSSHSYNQRFPSSPGEQERRLAGLSGETKRKFCQSFWRNYIASDREEPGNYKTFYDPDSREVYINWTYQHFKGRFEKEHPKQ